MDARPSRTSQSEIPIALSLRSVSKSLRSTRVLDDVSLDLAVGETLVLLGANGAGKTTLIKCLLDLIAPDQGEIEIFGTPARVPGARNHVAYLPERFVPPAHLTGGQFLDFWFELLGGTIDDGRLAHALAALGLAETALDRPVASLSKGMAQKLGLAGLLSAGSALIVADEPMSGLDPLTRMAVRRLLNERRVSGASALLTTHLVSDATDLADRVGILDGGRLVFLGTPAELLQKSGESDLDAAFLAGVSGKIGSNQNTSPRAMEGT